LEVTVHPVFAEEAPSSSGCMTEQVTSPRSGHAPDPQKRRFGVSPRTPRARRAPTKARAELKNWIDAVDELLDQVHGRDRASVQLAKRSYAD
jgi:hypothetical protein